MTYKINGVTITAQPTSGAWQKRDLLGTDGNGHSVYPGYRRFEMQWNLMEESDFAQVQAFYDSLVITGSVVVELPEYGANAYQFKAYTGCIIHEPTINDYFSEHPTKAVLLVTHIKV